MDLFTSLYEHHAANPNAVCIMYNDVCEFREFSCGCKAVYLDSVARKRRFPQYVVAISKKILLLLSKCDHTANFGLMVKHGT